MAKEKCSSLEDRERRPEPRVKEDRGPRDQRTKEPKAEKTKSPWIPPFPQFWQRKHFDKKLYTYF